MQSIRKRLSILFIICSIAAILLVTFSVNITVNHKFNEYMENIQDQRYERIVSYFDQVYKKNGTWTEDAGIELMHEAYMGNYCLTVKDAENNVIWGMDPTHLQNRDHLKSMFVESGGVYTTNSFDIESDGIVVGTVEIGQYSSVLLSEEDIQFKTSINKSIITSAVIALILVTSLGLYFSRQFSNPIKEVANMSVRLSEGNFDVKSTIKSKMEEIENLRISTNILAEKLKYQDSLRKRLVSDLSHEIRTPLNILQNNLEAMIDGVIPITADELISLNEEVIRFGRLVDNLKILKEFETDSIKLSHKEISLDKLITDICKEFYMAAEKKNIEIEYSLEPNRDYLIIGDKDKLKQVFINILSNAVKFTEMNGQIHIRLHSDAENIHVEIKDNGIGIKEEDLPFIFERLYRGDKSRHQVEGNGIGLTIVKNILQLHQAKIEVDSIEGKGTTVKIQFFKR